MILESFKTYHSECLLALLGNPRLGRYQDNLMSRFYEVELGLKITS